MFIKSFLALCEVCDTCTNGCVAKWLVIRAQKEKETDDRPGTPQ
jgi:hypothetical protein